MVITGSEHEHERVAGTRPFEHLRERSAVPKTRPSMGDEEAFGLELPREATRGGDQKLLNIAVWF